MVDEPLEAVLAASWSVKEQTLDLAPVEIAVKRIRRRRMQRDQPALAELCSPDQQNAVGLQVVEPQVERF